MKNGSKSASRNRLACSMSTPFKRYPISSETLYSEILMLITEQRCAVDDLSWRFQLKLEEVFNSVATLKDIEAVLEEVVVNMQLEGVSNGVRTGSVC